MRTPSLHASPARCHDECKTPGAVRRIAATPRPGTAPALRPARLVHRPRAMMRAARFELGSIERRYAHFRALQAGLDGTVAQVRQFRCEIVS